MPRISPAVAHFRAKKARADQLGDTAASEQAERALVLARTEETVRRALEDPPPLDAATVARLHALIPAATVDLTGGGDRVA